MYLLRIELPESLEQPLEQAAAEAGTTPGEWVRAVVSQRLAQTDARLRCHFGAVDLGAPTGADNDSIDADLARAYTGSGD